MAQRTFTIRTVFLSVGKGTMNAPRYWQLRDDAFNAVETIFFISLLRDEFHGHVGN
jgi:hypothetical protein